MTEVEKVAEAQVPASIIRELTRNGWNIFGIYELVRETLIEYNREQNSQPPPFVDEGLNI